MTRTIPDELLLHHTAILGKTGSGKTSTEKLLVEQAVAEGFRVCVLDSIKSDWWGITSSADGKKPGLPFRILGGPRGHVPLHSSAGKAIGKLVGSGQLPLSIIDMADFEPGGLQRFFIDFAGELMRHMRGVVYLVIEEAHEFAPKEKSGVGGESMATHWAKKLATAGRSKGVRLVVATQRTQALHNAVLGSCETIIVHRLTAPADQKPVLDWLKANASKETVARVEESLSSLPTGTAWVCSGEAKIFDLMAFPRFATFDNNATPTNDSGRVEVTTAPVDQSELRAIIGDAVKEAEANDPAALKRRIAELEKQMAAAPRAVSKAEIEAAEKRGFDLGAEHGKTVGASVALTVVRNALNGLRIPEFLQDAGSPGGKAPSSEELVPAPAHSLPPKSPLPAYSGVEILSPSARKIVDAVKSAYPMGLSLTVAAKRAGLSSRSSAYRKHMQDAAGCPDITERADGKYVAVSPPDGVPTPPGVAAFRAKLPPAYAKMLDVLENHLGRPVDKLTIAQQAGVSPTSSGLGAGLKELIALELIEKTDAGYRLSPDFL